MISQDKKLPLANGIKLAYDKRSKAYYYDISCALDTETSNLIKDDEHKYSWIYIFQIMIGDVFITCRTFPELKTIFGNLKTMYNLSEKQRLIIYIHNLPFEFQFMRTEFQTSELLARKNRSVFKVFLTEFGIELRDSLILSGMSLAKTAENLTSHNIRKLKGDLDYNLIRLPTTPITPTEMGYCYNDVKIICDYIDEQRSMYGDIAKIPLTNTGRVRRFVKQNCFHTEINPQTHKKCIPYKNLMERLTLEVSEYAYAKQAFLGGYTHANPRYSKKLLKDVHSIDFTSSYPTVMISEKYPMSKGAFIKLDMWDYQDFISFLKDRVALVMVEIWDMETRPEIPDDYISSSRLFEHGKNIMKNNGRVHKADYVKLIVTSVDLAQIVICYKYTKIHIIDGYFYYTDYLPREIIESILELYQKKTTLKGVKGKETEYLLSKGMLNSCYGMCVTDIVSDEEVCDETGWHEIPADIDKCINQYNENPNRFLSYIWGVFVTAYARNNLFNGIRTISIDYVYCDTDSIKFLNKSKHDAYINDYNNEIIRKCRACLDYYNIDYDELCPKTIKGVKKQIGVWDYEGKYEYFKTLGCKRYLTYANGSYDLTCAGLPDKNGLTALLKDGTDVDEVFNRFSDDFAVDSEHAGKLAHFYNDEPYKINVIDYNGFRGTIDCKSCVVLFPVGFSINGSIEYKLFLDYYIGLV